MTGRTFGFPSPGGRALADPGRLAARAARDGALKGALAACRADIKRREQAVQRAQTAYSTAAGEFYVGTVDEEAVRAAKKLFDVAQDDLEEAQFALNYLAPRAPSGVGSRRF